KIPASNSESGPGLGITTEASPQSLKRNLDDELCEGEARRVKLIKALEEEFGTDEVNRNPEEEDDDELRSLFEEDLEDTTDAPAFQPSGNPEIATANSQAEE